jgi:hypothetical protein
MQTRRCEQNDYDMNAESSMALIVHFNISTFQICPPADYKCRSVFSSPLSYLSGASRSPRCTMTTVAAAVAVADCVHDERPVG